MTKIKARKFTTIDVTPDEIYELDFGTMFTADFMNYTDGNVCISFDSTFNDDGDAKNYLELGKGCAYNSLKNGIGLIYIKAESSGKVAVVMTY